MIGKPWRSAAYLTCLLQLPPRIGFNPPQLAGFFSQNFCFGRMTKAFSSDGKGARVTVRVEPAKVETDEGARDRNTRWVRVAGR